MIYVSMIINYESRGIQNEASMDSFKITVRVGVFA
jgi:hypothetical protein